MTADPDWWQDPTKVAKAKELAAGPAGEILSKYPLYYAKALFFGGRPKKGQLSKINNATATLLELPTGMFAITCAHVIDGYRQFLAEQKHDALFQIGDLAFDPIAQLASEHKEIDLAVIRLTNQQAKQIATGNEIGSRFVKPTKWPPAPVKKGDVITFGGFPGALRERKEFDEFVFGTFSAAGIFVSAAREVEFVCQFERDYWIASFSEAGKDPLALRQLGGLSGAPVFADRGLHLEFAGIVYEFSGEFDIMRIRPATLLGGDGQITL